MGLPSVLPLYEAASSSHRHGTRGSSGARRDEERPYRSNTRANTGVFTARHLREQHTGKITGL